MKISLVLAALPFLPRLVQGLNQRVSRDVSVDVCGEVDAPFQVPDPHHPGKKITIGVIQECLCISALPVFISTSDLAIAASALVGKATVTASLTTLINNSNGRKQCFYPSHSLPSCKYGNPCYFTCKDGYTPYPAGDYPTTCICAEPYTDCNGKCGSFHGCPSAGHYKREVVRSERQCPKGLTACGVPGRSARSWDCVDTHNDLESCGGCTFSPLQSLDKGIDCTSLAGVSDVSCVGGRCVVHRCMPGYDIHLSGSGCVYQEDKDPHILAAQYGLEHEPLA